MKPEHPIKLGLAHLTALHLRPVEFIRAAASAGYESISLRVSSAAPGSPVYPLAAGSDALREVRTALHDEGVRLAEVELVPLVPELDPASVTPVLETGAELGATLLVVTGDDPDRAALTAKFAAVCDLAASFGMGVEIEFMRWRAAANLQDARDIVVGADRANGHILLDMLHHFRAGGLVADLGDVPSGLISVVHLCDAPAFLPDGMTVVEEARGARYPTGCGGLPIRNALQVLQGNPALAVELPMTLVRPELSAAEIMGLGYGTAVEVIRSLP